MANVRRTGPNRHGKHNYWWAVVVAALALKHWARFDSVILGLHPLQTSTPLKKHIYSCWFWFSLIYCQPHDCPVLPLWPSVRCEKAAWHGFVDALRLWQRRHPDRCRPRTRRGGSPIFLFVLSWMSWPNPGKTLEGSVARALRKCVAKMWGSSAVAPKKEWIAMDCLGSMKNGLLGYPQDRRRSVFKAAKSVKSSGQVVEMVTGCLLQR